MSKCKNFEFCGEYTLDTNNLCTLCIKNNFGELNIIDANDECDICTYKYTRKLMFPTGCGHSFCIGCSIEVLLQNEPKYGISQVKYGCPPCPNKCENPKHGKQCECEEYKVIIDKWKKDNPQKYKKFRQMDALTRNDNVNCVQGIKMCFLCNSLWDKK